MKLRNRVRFRVSVRVASPVEPGEFGAGWSFRLPRPPHVHWRPIREVSINCSEQFVEVHRKRTQILRGGSGPPLLYLHSAGGEVAWLPFFEQLAERFDVIVPAHPGFAESEGLDQIDSMEDLVFHYIDLMELLALERPGMVGLSLGGWVAAEFATRWPNLIRALVLIAPVGLRCPTGDIFSASPAETRELVFSDPAGPLAMQFIPESPDLPTLENYLKARDATARLGWNPYLHSRKLEGRLYRVSVPSLILAAGADKLVPTEHCQLYVEGIDGAKLQVFEGAGHGLPFERPDDTARAVIDFLA